MLTLQDLENMAPHHRFAHGTTSDSPEGVNMTNSKQELRWVALRGGARIDWAIYIAVHGWDENKITAEGDKVTALENIRKLVPCDDEAFAAYRY